MRVVRNEVSKALHSGCRRLLTAFDEVSSNFEEFADKQTNASVNLKLNKHFYKDFS